MLLKSSFLDSEMLGIREGKAYIAYEASSANNVLEIWDGLKANDFHESMVQWSCGDAIYPKFM